LAHALGLSSARRPAASSDPGEGAPEFITEQT
jgi:hypothetical protein